jgi:hypothetical protein
MDRARVPIRPWTDLSQFTMHNNAYYTQKLVDVRRRGHSWLRVVLVVDKR